MTNKDWQARAIGIARTYEFSTPNANLLTKDILTFAREYAAEALAEVERLKMEVTAHENARHDEGSAHLKCIKDRDDIRAQLAAAGPVKVPDKQWLVNWLLDCQAGNASCRFIADRIIEEVLRLNAAPPKENW